jgi:hypothetical protein
MKNRKKVKALLRHVKMVESNMQRLADLIIDESPKMALELIIRSRKHDLSKFEGAEFEYLWKDEENFNLALTHHRAVNDHHPERGYS